jgi:hypothetical protein
MKFRHWLKWRYAPPLAVLLSGKARHGKDTFGRYLKEELEDKFGLKVQRISFGDVLKNMTNYPSRNFLQQLGLILRATRGDDYLIHRAVEKYNGADVIIITDCRFPNEISYFENMPRFTTMTFRVTRITSEGLYESDLTDKQKNHPSETALDKWKFDFYIQATNVDELKEAAQSALPIVYDAWQRGFTIDSSDSYYWYP